MAYEYQARISNSISKNKDYFFTTTAKDMKDELEEVYRKARAFDEISKYVKRKLSAEVPLDDDYLIGRFESYETIQELMEDK